MTIALPDSPYKGLARFDDSDLDAQFFFGRERETELVAANLVATRLTVLYGPSGVGKSSLLRAGVVRRLRALVPAAVGAPEAQGPLPVVVDAWRDDPLLAVAAAAGARPPEAGEELADVLAERVAERDGELYLVLDQMEEYFVYHGRAAGGPLRDALAGILGRPELRVHVLLGIRDDALAELDAFKGRVPSLFGNVLRLDHLDLEAARSAIVEPLVELEALGGPKVVAEPALVAAVVDQVASGRIERRLAGRGVVPGTAPRRRIEAPYLQLVMERIWEVERTRGSAVLQAATLAELGGAGKIVQDHLEHALDGLPEGDRAVVSRVFRQLVTPSGTKIAYAVNDLSRYAGEPPERLEGVLQSLSAERVVRAVPGRNGGGARYEIFHDVLGAAVLEWGARYEAEQALAEERRAARRRNRRFAFIAGCAGFVLAALALLTVYAFDQRAEAQEQAERATRAAATAQAATRKAQANERRAATAEAKASASAKQSQKDASDADAAREDAEHQTEIAEGQTAEAKRQRLIADDAKADALREAAAAKEARDDAQTSAQKATDATEKEAVARREAERETAKAELATASAQEARRQAQAEAAVSEATSLLTVDPEQSLTLALAGAGTPSAARSTRSLRLGVDDEHTLRLERVLREGLLAARARVVLPGGGGRIPMVATSPDGSLVVVPAGDGEARVFEVATGKLVTRIEHGAELRTAVFSPDGRSVVTGGADGFARRWGARDGSPIAVYRHGAAIREIAFSPDGTLLATAAGQAARLWNAVTGVAERRLAHPVSVVGVLFNPAGTQLLTVARDARVYDLGTPGFKTLDAREDIAVARFAPVGPLVVTAGRDDAATTWDARDGSKQREFVGHGGNVLDVAWNPDATLLATASADNGALVWEAATASRVTFLGAHSNHVTSVVFSPDGRSIATTSLDGSARIWSGNLFARSAPLLGHSASPTDVTFTPDGATVVTASEDGSARLWRPDVDPVLSLVGRHGSPLSAVAASADGELVLTAGSDGVVRIWRNRRVVRALVHGAPLVDAALSRDGKLALTADGAGIARLWRVQDGKPLGSFPHGAALRAVAFAPSGAQIVTGGADGLARIWEATGRQVRALRHGGIVTAVAFSPDGAMLATGGDDARGRVWRLSDGRLLEPLLALHGDDITSISYSPDGRYLLTSSRDADARVWSAETRAHVRLLRGHTAMVSEAVFSPDGRWVATAGPITVGVWEAVTGRRIDAGTPGLLLRGHAAGAGGGPGVRAVAFSRDHRIFSAGDDGTVRTYRCELCGDASQLLRLARRRLDAIGRTLAPAERTRYIGAP